MTRSARAWGLLIERALADIAGSYDELHQTEPNLAWLTLLGPDANVKRYRLDSDSNIWSCQVPRHVGSRSSDDQLPTEALRSRSRDSRTKSWKAAKHWNLHDKQLTDEELSSRNEEDDPFVAQRAFLKDETAGMSLGGGALSVHGTSL